MKFATFPSFRQNGSIIQLADFLSKIPENGWIWTVLDFYGIGNAPNDLSMEEFEVLVRSKSKGFIMKWSELRTFSNSLIQTFDCLIVAAKSVQDISTNKLAKENFSNCEIVIEAFDRTEWLVWARDPNVMASMLTI
ncbi:MAG: hypothetical protein HC877_12930 [Thioploca sp.]|nr:hypothetical protein [Thioploca sp.]